MQLVELLCQRAQGGEHHDETVTGRTAAPGGPAYFAYSTNYLIDTEHGVTMDVEATPAHITAEVDSA